MQFKQLIMCCCALVGAMVMLAVPAPVNAGQHLSGWRYPEKADMKAVWSNEVLPTPYHIHADFDGDDIGDDIWLMIRMSGSGWAVMAFMSSMPEGSGPLVVREFPEGEPQNHGILFIAPGSDQKTACGLGVMRCGPGDAYTLHAAVPTFQLFNASGGSSFFYWDAVRHRFYEDTIED